MHIMKKNKSLLFLIAALPFAGCSTELEVNAPYEDITVVYGLMDASEPIQYIKINKAFLGEGDALVYAQIPDSNEYSGEAIEHARVHRVEDGQITATFDLQDTVIDRDPGVFYSPHRLYYFLETFIDTINAGQPYAQPIYLDQNAEYELDLKVKGSQLSARTTVVNNFTFHSVTLAAAVTFRNSAGYTPYTFRWNSGLDGKRYEASWRFHYSEVSGSDTIRKSIEQRIGQVTATNSQSSQGMELVIQGEDFFRTVGERVAAQSSNNVSQRIFTGLEFVIAVANDEFHTILTLSEPISGIVEERPAYSNVQNGHGIFASRFSGSIMKELNSFSGIELRNGTYTGDLLFCVDYPDDGVPIMCD